MSGFGSVIGAMIGFFLVIALFVGTFMLYNKGIMQSQQSLLENIKESEIKDLENLELKNLFMDSGRYKFFVDNKGEILEFKKKDKICFEVFFNDDYLGSSNTEFFLDNKLDGDYSKLLNSQDGYLYLNVNRDEYNLEDEVIIVTCNSNKYKFVVNDTLVNWYNNSYLEREELVVEDDMNSRENEKVEINLSSHIDFQRFKSNEFDILYPIEENLILDLTFDYAGQVVEDFSRLDSDFILGTNTSSEIVDPIYYDGIIFDGLNFEENDFISGNFDMNNDKKTISFWFKSNSTLNLNSIDKTFFDFGSKYIIGFNKLGNGEIGFYRKTGVVINYDISTTTNFWQANKWYNIIIVIDNDNRNKIAVNGKIETSILDDVPNNNVNNLKIGVMS